MSEGVTAEIPRIAVLGAGNVGRTLAAGWLRPGHPVVLGSRDPGSERVAQAVAEVAAAAGPASGSVSAATHADAVADADVVILAVPGDQAGPLAADLGERLSGKVVIDASNNLGSGQDELHALHVLSEAGALGYRAFNTVGWEQMAQPVFGTQRADLPYAGPAGEQGRVEQLISEIGFRPVYFGADDGAIRAVDDLARLWFRLAFGRGYGRRLAWRLLTADDDEPPNP